MISLKCYYFKKTHLSLVLITILSLLIAYLGYQQIKQIKVRTFNQVPKVNVIPSVESNNKSATIKENKNKKVKQELFVEYRIERDRNRDRQMELLKEMINNTNSTDETRKEAQKRILAMSQTMEQELELENLVKARGFKDAIALMQNTGLTILVQKPTLSAEDSTLITDISEQTTSLDRSKIVVIAKL